MMVLKFDPDSRMELASIPRTYATQHQHLHHHRHHEQQPLRLPLRTLQPRFIHANNAPASREHDDSPYLTIPTGRRQSEPGIVEPLLRSPTWSSYSQDSYTEYDAAASTAPSSPPEFGDLHSSFFPSRRPSLQPVPLDFTGESLPPLHGESPIQRLPKIESLFSKPQPRPSSGPPHHLDKRMKLSPTPEPCWTSSNYVCSRDSILPFKQGMGEERDGIIQALNKLREMRAGMERRERRMPLRTPAGIDLKIKIDLSPPQQRWYEHAIRPYGDGGIRKNKRKNLAHCNKKYTKEQRDYIRYHHVDTKKHWSEIKEMFYAVFPDDEWVREVQGIQGVYYRDNKEIPNLDVNTNKIIYENNGHCLSIEQKVREQAEHKNKWGLVNLFPEFALGYTWVSPEDRQRAAELSKTRRKEKEEAKRLAVQNGTWQETTDKPCGCCNLQRAR